MMSHDCDIFPCPNGVYTLTLSCFIIRGTHSKQIVMSSEQHLTLSLSCRCSAEPDPSKNSLFVCVFISVSQELVVVRHSQSQGTFGHVCFHGAAWAHLCPITKYCGNTSTFLRTTKNTLEGLFLFYFFYFFIFTRSRKVFPIATLHSSSKHAPVTNKRSEERQASHAEFK